VEKVSKRQNSVRFFISVYTSLDPKTGYFEQKATSLILFVSITHSYEQLFIESCPKKLWCVPSDAKTHLVPQIIVQIAAFATH
jgi:hypothetical protein